MSRMGGRLIWGAPVASGLLLAATGALALGAPVPSDHFLDQVLPNVVLGLVLPLLGAIVLSKLPGHPLGRLWVLTGVAGALTLAVHTYALFGSVVRPGAVPFTAVAAWVSSWLWVLGFTPLLTLGLLLFPDGRLPSSRWRPLLAVAGAAVVLPILGQALAPGRLEQTAVENPLGVPALAELTALFRGAGALCFTVAVAGGAAALVVRWRRGGPEQRRQLALPAVAAGLLGATFLVPAADPLLPWLDTVIIAEVTLLLLSFGVAVLRDRVAGAEVVLRRSLTYGLLTGALTFTYAAAVATLSALVNDRGADLLAAVATALIAMPLRDRLRRIVDRAVYGERFDPFTALDRLNQRLDGAADPESVLTGVAESVATILRLPSVRVVVISGDNEVVAASAGADRASWTRLPLRHHDEQVGALLVAPRSGQTILDPRDLRMLEALCRPAGAAVAAVRMSTELRRSRQRIVAAREEERRRLRRDLHDGLGPTLAGIGLGLEVARAASDPIAVDRLLIELKQEAAAAVLDVRRLVEDLRPPALDELGLVGALREHADRITHRNGCAVTVKAAAIEGLPAAVEVAAYRIAMEAVTNAVRHAHPSACLLALALDDVLTVEVTDNGSGMPASQVDGLGLGVGLAAMRERATELGGTLRVGAGREGGTTVIARLPLQGR